MPSNTGTSVVPQKHCMNRSWWHAGLLVVAVFVVAMAFRMPDYAKWQNPVLSVDGEYIMATHDAYHWLAGAKGVGAATGTPMARMTSLISDTLGVGLDKVGFWAPAIAAGLTAGAVALWGWSLGGLGVGFFAGVLGVLGSGYYFRTRLGFYDTDIVTLFFPVLLSWLLAVWLRPHMDMSRLQRAGAWVAGLGRRFWRGGKEQGTPGNYLRNKIKREKSVAEASTCAAMHETVHEPLSSSGKDMSPLLLFGLPLVAGFTAAFAGIWHGQLANFTVLLLLGGLVLAMVLLRPGLRGAFLWGGVLYCLAAYEGPLGMGFGLALFLCFSFLNRQTSRVAGNVILAGLCLAVLFYRLDIFQTIFVKVGSMLSMYGGSVAESPITSGDSIAYPAIVQSVIEAQRLPLAEALNKIHPWIWLVWLGSLGFLTTCVVRPEALLLLPLLVLALGAPRLGIRMVMFGGPCVALGVAMIVQWGVQRLDTVDLKPLARGVGTCAVWVLLTTMASWPFIDIYPKIPTTPVFNKQHAKALIALKDIAPADSMVWTWWDWGFATQYYSGLMSFGDGAKHTGSIIFPLGLVMGTPRPMQANQMMKYLALSDYALALGWQKTSVDKAIHDLVLLNTKKLDLRTPHKQYFVATYENLRLINWIMYYATWDLRTKKGIHPRTAMLQGASKVNTKTGSVENAVVGPKPLALRTVDILSSSGRQYYDFPKNTSDLHLIINEATGEHHLLDDVAYGSMMVQALISPADNPTLNEYFKLVYDDFPYIRIFEAR